MTSAINAARWLCRFYYERNSKRISEMVLHKLLYFSQREALIADADSPLFPEPFEAWKYGPVLCAIRASFSEISNSSEGDFEELSNDDEKAIKSALDRYSGIDPWGLVNLTHGESSWINARNGCGPGDRCRNEITVEAIRIDAERIRCRRRLLDERRRLSGRA